MTAHLFLGHWLDGKAFFTGTGLLLLATLGLVVLPRQAAFRIAATATGVLGLGILLSSATPVAGWLLTLCLLAFLLWQLLEHLPPETGSRWRQASGLVLAGLVALMLGRELPYHFRPSLPPETHRHVLVIGDSVSAGIGNPDDPTWPMLLARQYDIEMHDAAHAGATVRDALERQLPQLRDTPGLLILEIGGNDVLRGTSRDEFAAALDDLLRQSRRPDRTLVMFELPGLPGRTHYMATQRRLAREHGVHLIPRRYFLQLIRVAEHTTDGIHLTEQGQVAMFELVVDLLGDRLPARDAPPAAVGPPR